MGAAATSTADMGARVNRSSAMALARCAFSASFACAEAVMADDFFAGGGGGGGLRDVAAAAAAADLFGGADLRDVAAGGDGDFFFAGGGDGDFFALRLADFVALALRRAVAAAATGLLRLTRRMIRSVVRCRKPRLAAGGGGGRAGAGLGVLVRGMTAAVRGRRSSMARASTAALSLRPATVWNSDCVRWSRLAMAALLCVRMSVVCPNNPAISASAKLLLSMLRWSLSSWNSICLSLAESVSRFRSIRAVRASAAATCASSICCALPASASALRSRRATRASTDEACTSICCRSLEKSASTSRSIRATRASMASIWPSFLMDDGRRGAGRGGA